MQSHPRSGHDGHLGVGGAGRPRRRRLRGLVSASVVAGLVLTLLTTPAGAGPVADLDGSALQREPQITPQELSDPATADLQYPDPAEGLTIVEAPTADNTGAASLDYELVVPEGRGLTPRVALAYSSTSTDSWVGQGWDLSMGDISVDTRWGTPAFCAVDTAPRCGDVESETYTLDGQMLMPNAISSTWEPRIAERQDFTRRVETEFEQIIRHGDSPKNYFWEVRAKTGNIRWYGGYPDEGGPFGKNGTRSVNPDAPGGVDELRNDRGRDPSSILSDDQGNAVRWFLTAERDVGVNEVRYYYDTVEYESVARRTSSTGWQAVPDGTTCPGTCARHVYLNRVEYTSSSEVNPLVANLRVPLDTTSVPAGERPVYRVAFLRGQERPDARLDARGGFLDLTLEQLTAVEVTNLKTAQPVSRYDLDYKVGAYGKKQLRTITQTGCAADAGCDPSTASVHRFEYYDDVRDNEDYVGFAAPAEADTFEDDLDNGRLEGRESALGMSQTDSGDGRIYLGFNPAAPTKTGSFGGSLSLSGGSTESLVEFMDINGDSLPDKVFRDPDEPGRVSYRLNASRPGDPGVTFEQGEPRLVSATLDGLPTERSFGVAGGIEAYFGVYAQFVVGGSWSFADSYFSDVNGDGLPDWVESGSVLYNHLECTDACVPTFSPDDDRTKVPLDQTSTPRDEALLASTTAMLRAQSPRVDTVRRWVAPFTGTVRIDSAARLLPSNAPGTPSDCDGPGARAAIQHNLEEVSSCVLGSAGEVWDAGLEPRAVTKGDRLYFRLGTRLDGGPDEVEWDPSITYVAPAGPALDVNGLSQTGYSASGDFTTAGRPTSFVTMPKAGDVRFSAVLVKGVTSDDVAPLVFHLPGVVGPSPVVTRDVLVSVEPLTAVGAVDTDRVKRVVPDGGSFCVRTDAGVEHGCYPDEAAALARTRLLGKDEVGAFGLSAGFTATAPILQTPALGDPPDPGKIIAQDSVQAVLRVDSPIDVDALDWSGIPSLCYLAAGATACDATSAGVTPHVDVDVYPSSSLTAPATPYSDDETRTVTPRVSFDLLGTPAGQVVFTAKTAGGFLYKQILDVEASPAVGPFPAITTITRDLPELELKADTEYWFDLSVRDPALSDGLSARRLQLRYPDPDDSTVTLSEDAPLTARWAGRQGFFPLAYRGWGVAGYNGEGTRGTDEIREGDFVLSAPDGGAFEDANDACQALNGRDCITEEETADLTFPGGSQDSTDGPPAFDPEVTKQEVPDAYPYLPWLDRVASAGTTMVVPSWRGPKDSLRGRPAGLSADRLGQPLPTVGTVSPGTLSPPNLWSATGPVFSLTAGVGPISAAFAAGWSSSVIDYLDMNGDGFPDIVEPGRVLYTNPRGGFCESSAGVTPCAGAGTTAVNNGKTLSVSGGFGGAPIGVSANSRGTANSTQGNSGNKGGAASDAAFGSDLGGSLGISTSFTNPTSSVPKYAEGDTSEVPEASPGTPIQKVLADVNGDGLPDRVTVDELGVFVQFNLGDGFTPQPVLWAGGGFETSESYTGSVGVSLGFSGAFFDFSGGVSRNASVDFPRVAWIDVNGDGVLDALRKDGATVLVAFGTGTGLTAAAKFGDMAELPFEIAGEITAATDDQVRQDSSVSYGGGLDFTMGFGPLCLVGCYLIVNPGGHFDRSLSTTDIDLQDVDGDGYPDSVARVDDTEKVTVHANTHRRTGLLASVENPLGGTIRLDYTREGNTVESPSSAWTLSRVEVDDGRPGDGVNTQATTYEYTGGRYDKLHRENLGYAEVVERELDVDGTVLRSVGTSYRNGTVFDAGLATTTVVRSGDVDGAPLHRTDTSWDVLNLDTGLPADLEPADPNVALSRRVTPQQAEVTDRWYTAGGATGQETTTRYTYDDLGNAVVIEDQGEPETTADDLVATITYSDCTNANSEGPDSLEDVYGCGADDSTVDTPTAPSPFWSADRCWTWVSVPAVLEIRDASGTLLRRRDGSNELCHNASITVLAETVEQGSDPAVTELLYDEWGSYDRIVYPEGAEGPDTADGSPRTPGTRYSVLYVRDDVGASHISEVTDFELDADEVVAFMDDDAGSVSPAVGDDSRGLTTGARFDSPAGLVTERTDPNGRTTTYSYDALSRLTDVSTPDGGGVTFEYHPGDPAYAWAAARHEDRANPGDTIDTATFADGLGRVTQTKREATLFTGQDTPTDTGYTVTGAVAFDALGRGVAEKYPVSQLGAALGERRPAGPDDPAPTIRLTYDALDRLTSKTTPGGSVTSTVYGFGSVGASQLFSTEVTDPEGRRTRSLADVRDTVLAVDDTAVDDTGAALPPLRTVYRYNPVGDLLDVTPPGGDPVEHTYDLLGRRTSTSTPDGGLVDYGYDDAGNQVSEQSPVLRADGDSRTRYSYRFGRLTGIDYPDQTSDVTLRWGGYSGGDPQDDAVDNRSGQLAEVTDGARHQLLSYDVNGLLSREETTMRGRHPNRGPFVTSFDHDWLGRLQHLTYPDTERVSYGYDTGGNLDQLTGAKACTDLGRLAATITATQTVIMVTETPHSSPSLPFTVRVGKEQMQVTARAATAAPGQFAYTVVRGVNGTLEVPTAVSHQAGAKLASDVAVQCLYRYLDRLEYDEFVVPEFQQVGNGVRTQVQRDADTRRLDRQVTTVPQQSRVQQAVLTAPAAVADSSVTVKETYSPPLPPFTATLGAERIRVTARVATATPDVFTYTVERAAGGTTAVRHAPGAALLVDREIQNLGYAYDRVGNVQSYENDLPPDAPSLFGGYSRQDYSYDPYYRVEQASGSWVTAPQTTRRYTFDVTHDDQTGNLLAKSQRDWLEVAKCKGKTCTTSINVVEATTYSFDDISYSLSRPHQLVTQGGATYDYDLDGNLARIAHPADGIRDMTWDAAGKMRSVTERPPSGGGTGVTTTYAYDYEGRLAIEDREQGQTSYVNPWVSVRNGTMWKHVWADDDRLATKFSQIDEYEEKVYFLHKDLQGSTNVVTDRVGKLFQHHEYFPSGEVWAREDSTVFRTPYQFAGGYVDEDHGLVNFGQRWYDPRGQHFYSVDPELTQNPASILTTPQLQATYTYANANPLRFVDPEGRVGQEANTTALIARSIKHNVSVFAVADWAKRKQGTLGGAIGTSVLRNIGSWEKAQAKADAIDDFFKPLVELTIDKDSAGKTRFGVRLSAGAGPQADFGGPAADPSAASPPARPAAPAPDKPPVQRPPSNQAPRSDSGSG